MAEESAEESQSALVVFNMINKIRGFSKQEKPSFSLKKSRGGIMANKEAVASGIKNQPVLGVLSTTALAGYQTLQGIKYLNTYHLYSKNPFDPEKVQKILQEILDERLTNLVYEQDVCAKLCVELSSEIRSRVKTMQFERYKLICIVQICEKNNQSVVSQSRFLWDPERDRYAVYSLENNTLLAAGLVYGIYYE